MAGNRAESDKIAKFIRKALLQGDCERLELRHVINGEGDRKVQDWRLKSEEIGEGGAVDADTLCDVICEAAREDAEAFDGVQSYAVLAWHEGDGSMYRARAIIRTRGSMSDVGGLIESSEPATAKGLINQQMRHLEATQRTMMNVIANVTAQQARTIENLTDKLGQADKDRLEAWEATRRVFLSEEERAEAAAERKRKTEKDKWLLDRFESLAFPALGRLLGPGGGDVKGAVRESALLSAFGKFLSGFSQEQITGIMANMNEDQRTQFLEFYQAVAKEVTANTPPGPKPEEAKKEETNGVKQEGAEK
jgi:hypothetical protein